MTGRMLAGQVVAGDNWDRTPFQFTAAKVRTLSTRALHADAGQNVPPCSRAHGENNARLENSKFFSQELLSAGSHDPLRAARLCGTLERPRVCHRSMFNVAPSKRWRQHLLKSVKVGICVPPVSRLIEVGLDVSIELKNWQ